MCSTGSVNQATVSRKATHPPILQRPGSQECELDLFKYEGIYYKMLEQ